ncbi:hypothetical protein [Streptobacillus moniliformis]|uniref:hypothetical protein n=1 Tax=Streptobacillus moniliformis TaxID=34105 RepID=UPI0007E44DEC|nr:hypothetical protein [Streptobacillus moniliformis]
MKKEKEYSAYLDFERRIEYRGKYRGYEIAIAKATLEIPIPYFGVSNEYIWYNGYIVLSKENKYYKKHYDYINTEIDIHGGFTFSEKIKDKYLIGFDTNHYFDNETTKTKEFVLEELKRAVDEIIVKNCRYNKIKEKKWI